MSTVAAVVVTYNRRALLSQQMVSVVENQTFRVDEYYIIDNHSTDDTESFVKEYSKSSPIKITYLKLEENVGGAGGFYYGLKRAYNDGHGWIILMDDDGRPYDNNCFKSVFDYVDKNQLSYHDKHFINSIVMFDDDNLSFGLAHTTRLEDIIRLSKNGVIDNLVNPFNGTFLSRGLINEVGFPIKEFFIKGDEYNYTLRSISSGANVFTLLSSRYFHPRQANVDNKKVMGRMVHLCIEAPWKEYYQVRNFAYTSLQRGAKTDAYKFFALRIYCAFIYKCPKMKTIHMMVKGLCDGLSGKLGKRVNP